MDWRRPGKGDWSWSEKHSPLCWAWLFNVRHPNLWRLAGRPSHLNSELRTALTAVKRESKHAINGVVHDGGVALGALGDGDGRKYWHARLLRESARRASSKQRGASLAHAGRIGMTTSVATPPLRKAQPDLPGDLVDLVERCLAIERGRAAGA